jgi:hypothetical protein
MKLWYCFSFSDKDSHMKSHMKLAQNLLQDNPETCRIACLTMASGWQDPQYIKK